MKVKLFLQLILTFSVCAKLFSQNTEVKNLMQFNLQIATNIRAIEVLNDSTVWFAGSKGVYGFTNDGGASFIIDTLKTDSLSNEIRSIAVLDEQTILLMNAGSPAFIWKSDDIGVTWKIVYENSDPDIFLDAIKFSDSKNGIAVGDPIQGCFQILVTHNGGETWKQIPYDAIPHSLGGEACFASSNSSIDIIGKSVWVGTGGLHSRVFSSTDFGEHWNALEVPVAEGKELTGIFSLDFADQYNGIVAGGDYEDQASRVLTISTTNNGGKTWKRVDDDDAPPFVSCVQHKPDSFGKTILAACLPGIYWSENYGSEWLKLHDENGNEIRAGYYTFRFSPSGKAAWFAGADGKIARLEFK